MTRALFAEGDHVRLKPDVDEGWPEEFGYFDTYEGNEMAIVTVWDAYRDQDGQDDGIREVDLDQLEHTNRDPEDENVQ